MNVYAPARYDERSLHLALGLEPRDASSDLRLDGGVDVRIERFPEPVSTWRSWAPGETLTALLPKLGRHRTGRYAARYEDRHPVGTNPTLRVVDDDVVGSTRRSGFGRRLVPRRIRVALASADVVRAADADPNVAPYPLWQRAFPLWVFPGSAAVMSSRATVLRGSVVRLDPLTGNLVPVRWCRVQARDLADREVGWAHGDDRGEFVMLVEAAAGAIGLAANPLQVRLTVGATLPPVTPALADPLRAVVDPLWDLPVEPITPAPVPAFEPTLTGRRFLAEHAVMSPLVPAPIDLIHGRETTHDIRIA